MLQVKGFGHLNKVSQYTFLKLLTISRLLEVDICIAKRTSCDYISADTDTKDWACCRKLFEQHSFSDIRVKTSHMHGSHRVTGTSWVDSRHFQRLNMALLDARRNKSIFAFVLEQTYRFSNFFWRVLFTFSIFLASLAHTELFAVVWWNWTEYLYF